MVKGDYMNSAHGKKTTLKKERRDNSNNNNNLKLKQSLNEKQ
jgi:hypothetical protein